VSILRMTDAMAAVIDITSQDILQVEIPT
jgi:hypothetical protein